MNNENMTVEQESRTQQKPKASPRVVRPNVDIFEDKSGITVLADLPGVSKEALDIQIDNEILSIDGRVEIPLPEGVSEEYGGFRTSHYQRSFTLSQELDGSKVEAKLKDGILSMHIPKREEFQPRKIEIRVE
ncbi:MAG: Hsp20/alpha crystallin family protein [Candidatus Thiodiazotropha sp.]|jgi:HSP20 family protein